MLAESDLLHSELTREIIGSAMEVHANLGSVYFSDRVFGVAWNGNEIL